MEELLDENFIDSLKDFAENPDGTSILEFTRKRLSILDAMVPKYSLDVDELEKVYDEFQRKAVGFRDHDLLLYDYLEDQIGRVPEICYRRLRTNPHCRDKRTHPEVACFDFVDVAAPVLGPTVDLPLLL